MVTVLLNDDLKFDSRAEVLTHQPQCLFLRVYRRLFFEQFQRKCHPLFNIHLPIVLKTRRKPTLPTCSRVSISTPEYHRIGMVALVLLLGSIHGYGDLSDDKHTDRLGEISSVGFLRAIVATCN